MHSTFLGQLGQGPNNWYQSTHDPVLEAHGWQSYSSHGGEESRLGASSKPPQWQSPDVPAPGVGGWQGLPQETPFQPQISATSLHEQRSRSINGKILQPKDSLDRMIEKLDHMNDMIDRFLEERARSRRESEFPLASLDSNHIQQIRADSIGTPTHSSQFDQSLPMHQDARTFQAPIYTTNPSLYSSPMQSTPLPSPTLQQQEETEPKVFEGMPVRKLGSTSWCRRCKIQCVTMEGLAIHSLTTEHQNRTLALVINIKQNQPSFVSASPVNVPMIASFGKSGLSSTSVVTPMATHTQGDAQIGGSDLVAEVESNEVLTDNIGKVKEGEALLVQELQSSLGQTSPVFWEKDSRFIEGNMDSYKAIKETMEVLPEDSLRDKMRQSADADKKDQPMRDLMMLMFKNFPLTFGFNMGDSNNLSFNLGDDLVTLMGNKWDMRKLGISHSFKMKLWDPGTGDPNICRSNLSGDECSQVVFSQISNWSQCSPWENLTVTPFTVDNNEFSFDNFCNYFQTDIVKVITIWDPGKHLLMQDRIEFEFLIGARNCHQEKMLREFVIAIWDPGSKLQLEYKRGFIMARKCTCLVDGLLLELGNGFYIGKTGHVQVHAPKTVSTVDYSVYLLFAGTIDVHIGVARKLKEWLLHDSANLLVFVWDPGISEYNTTYFPSIGFPNCR